MTYGLVLAMVSGLRCREKHLRSVIGRGHGADTFLIILEVSYTHFDSFRGYNALISTA
jgi:hypothetical protein